MNIPVADPQALEAYCLPFIRGEKRAETAAELMASRYVAYATGAIDYLIETHDPKTRAEADRGSIEAWSKRAKWHGLEFLKTEKGEAGDTDGTVEFIATFSIDGLQESHHELATFRKEGDRWYFVDGEVASKTPVRRTEAKVGRNDVCPCGSGKKYKKCHGAAGASNAK